MKKIHLLLSVLLINISTILADKVSVAEVCIPQNGQGMVVINYQFDEAEQYSGWQFSLVLPEGLSSVKNDKGNPTFVTGDCYDSSYTFSSSSSNESDDFVALSLQSTPVKGMEGTLISIPIVAVSEFEVGTSFSAILKGIQFGNKDGVHTTVINDVSFSITIGEPDDGRLKFYETSSTLPSYTPGEKADVTMHRTIKANQWSTIVFPFNLTKKNAETVFGSDVQFAQFSGFSVDYGDDEVNVVPLGITINLTNYTIPTRGNLAGGTPVLIKTSKDIDEIQIDNVTLTNGLEEVSKSDEYGTPGKLTGTLVKTVIPADGLFISDNKFWYSTGKTNVKAFRCWFELGAVLNQETDFGSRINLKFTDEDETTGISSVKSHQESMSFDLQGRKVTKFTKKGIYIENGKKKIVK